jgi:hypothetical protein
VQVTVAANAQPLIMTPLPVSLRPHSATQPAQDVAAHTLEVCGVAALAGTRWRAPGSAAAARWPHPLRGRGRAAGHGRGCFQWRGGSGTRGRSDRGRSLHGRPRARQDHAGGSQVQPAAVKAWCGHRRPARDQGPRQVQLLDRARRHGGRAPGGPFGLQRVRVAVCVGAGRVLSFLAASVGEATYHTNHTNHTNPQWSLVW